MSKLLARLTALMLVATMFVPVISKASHLAAGDIYYTYTGTPNTFLITLRLYRDCAGITMSSSETVCYTSASCNISQSITVNLVPGSGQQIPPSPCVPSAGPTTCQGGTAYGIEEYLYQAVLVMPAQCIDWKFQYETCCRNGNITTLNNAAGMGFYLETTMNNLDYPTNSSPHFNTIPVTQFCVNNQFYFDQGATDPDNDSITYSLINAQDASGGCPWTPFDLQYNAPYSGVYPISSANGVTMDLLTGVIAFLPNLLQNGVIAVRCFEYDRITGLLKTIGKREIQINIVSTCTVVTPSFDSAQVASGVNIVIDGINNVTCDDTTFYIQVNPPVQCGSIVPSDIRFLDPSGLPNPVTSAVGINCVNGLTDSIMVTVLNPIPTGTSYIFTKIGNDGNTFLSECGSPMNEFDTLTINLYDSVPYAFDVTDTLDCTFDSLFIVSNQLIDCFTISADGSDFTLVDANGTPITITGATCLGTNGGHFGTTFLITTVPTTNAAGPLTLIVNTGSDLNTIANGCGTMVLQDDTLGTIQVRNNITLSLGPDITVCASDPAPVLNAGNHPGATFDWLLNGNSTGQTSQTITPTVSGTYIVNVQSSVSCFGSDTVVVNLIPSPSVNIGNDITLCANDPFPTLDAGNPGATYQWYLNDTLIAGATSQQFTPTTAGTYYVEVSTGATCLGRDTINISQVLQLSVSVNDLSYCSGNAVTLQSTSANSGVNYAWTLNGNPIAGQTGASVPVTGSGVYAVTISTGSCSAIDSAIVTEVEQPTASLSNISQCDNVTLPVLNPGYVPSAGTNSVFSWTLNNNPVGGNDQALNTATTGAGNYNVTITNTSNGFTCTATASMTLTINATPAVEIGNNVTQCAGATPATLATANGTGNTYQWSLNNNIIVGANDTSITATSAGTYSVLVTSAGGCTNTDNVVVSINALPTPEIHDELQKLDSVLFCATQNPAPVLSLTSNVFIQSYNWTLDGNNLSTNANVTVAAIGEYQVTVIDSNGCSNTDVIRVIEAPCDLEIFNVITPNNDGKNDVFEVKNLMDFKTRKLTVFNRWGKKVYSADPYNNDWDGGNQAAGVYYFILEYDNGIKSGDKKGSFNIIR
ncbi:MAG TPA: gliding motility-associated C-terminal domain-containing protein [Bacteroidia bacterium]|nr:gliding motility-associated C-terminal domain-containing protein [Bacteroidia bacterium]HMX97326.1 gliding motility-associated C-terminal domain-containing protein [Bacteroidia bacterium]HMY13793.1 gliding motility-associated C-terminal domain-containing protein [Bacteroidia bacterium]HNB12452.1 gliding motility-associated C-terminal domain-containing protein [Bacteroidia bacterium]HND71335.1 gliding motility-associated C-terminal domain-containing protein [Bacteroidia bacterium]